MSADQAKAGISPTADADECLPRGEITDPLLHPSARWVSAVVTTSVPSADGDDWVRRTTLRLWSSDDFSHRDIHGIVPLAGRGLSGGVHCWSVEGSMLAVVTADALVVVRFDDGVVGEITTLASDARRWSTPIFDQTGKKLCAIADWSEVVVFDLERSTSESQEHDRDFAFDPAWWRDHPVFHGWSRPEMPWTRSAIVPLPSTIGAHQCQQPRSSPDGRWLGYLCDDDGVLGFRAQSIDGATIEVRDAHEFGGPTWGPGQRSWCWSPDGGKIAIARNVDGFGELSVIDITSDDRWTVGRAVHGCLSWVADTIAAVRSGAVTAPQLVLYDVGDLDHPRRQVIETADTRWRAGGVLTAAMVEPELRTASRGEVSVPYRLYRAQQPSGGLICWVHGGPTDQWQVTFMPRLGFWLSRGWDVAVVDPRGSTGHGRRHMLALHGGWGDADVDDLLDVCDDLHAAGAHVSRRTVLMGASAGGLTVLGAAARRPGSVAAVVSCFPVVDLELLARCDDRFEGHYVPTLVGADADWPARSPLASIDALATVPVLLFHGDSDDNVVPEHSARLHESLLARGGDSRLVIFEGEGHGFRRRLNQLAEYAISEEFLRSRVGSGADAD